jgi:MoxR-like ATPase
VGVKEDTVSITQDIQKRVAAIEIEMNAIIKERADVIHGALVARVGQLHLLMLGPGGSGKSFLVRELVSHISGAAHFETALDETTDPGQVFGPPDIKAMVEQGKTRRVTDGMLPEATDAFVDEIFNGNSPVLHSLMPMMNERIFHNNGMPSQVPLRSLYAGSNKLNADADLAAFFDRLHLRYTVGYVKSRQNQMDMVTEAISRMAQVGRGTITSLATSPTQVSVEELDIAHKEALALNMDDEVLGAFFDLHDALDTDGGIVISPRRIVEGTVAVLANAWVRNHEDVQIGDLDILAHMWWTLQDQAPKAQEIILGVANPSAKVALDLMSELDKIQSELENSTGLDDTHRMRLGVEAARNTQQLIKEAQEHLAPATAGGADTSLLTEVINRAEAFKNHVSQDVFGLDQSAAGN